jgi:cytochrome c
MDSYEVSKFLGAACLALLVIFVPKTLIEMRLADHGAEQGSGTPVVPAPEGAKAPQPAKDPASGEEKKSDAAGANTPAPPAAPNPAGLDVAKVISLIGSANADAGKTAFGKCLACHTAEKGAGNKLGPNLWGVIGRPKGAITDFTGYSAAMKDKGGNWTFEELAQFIHKPGSVIQGTKMIFPGIKDPQAVADVLAYVRTLADTPAELPK